MEFSSDFGFYSQYICSVDTIDSLHKHFQGELNTKQNINELLFCEIPTDFGCNHGCLPNYGQQMHHRKVTEPKTRTVIEKFTTCLNLLIYKVL